MSLFSGPGNLPGHMLYPLGIGDGGTTIFMHDQGHFGPHSSFQGLSSAPLRLGRAIRERPPTPAPAAAFSRARAISGALSSPSVRARKATRARLKPASSRET